MKRTLLYLLCFVLWCDTAYCAADANTTPAKGWDSFMASAEKDLPELPCDVLQGSKETYFRMDNFAALLLAGGASVVMHNEPSRESFDAKVASHFERHGNLPSDLDEVTSNVGGPGFHFAATGLWYGLASANKDDLNTQRAWTMLTALSITGATTLALKAAVNNEQPNQKHGMAWPSGHTASSFTVASVLDEFYGPQIGIPAYAAAGFVGYRMMDAGDHWASDVLFGGVLGWVVGHTVAGKEKQLKVAGFEVVPYFSESGANGIALVRQF